jgi:hypothetical protein
MSAKDSPFGVPLDCVIFATSAGYDNLQILMNKAEAGHSQTAQSAVNDVLVICPKKQFNGAV